MDSEQLVSETSPSGKIEYYSIHRDPEQGTRDLEHLLELNSQNEMVSSWRRTRSSLRYLDGEIVQAKGRRGRFVVSNSQEFLFHLDGNGFPGTARIAGKGFQCRVLSMPSHCFRFACRGHKAREIFRLSLRKPEDFEQSSSDELHSICSQGEYHFVQRLCWLTPAGNVFWWWICMVPMYCMRLCS